MDYPYENLKPDEDCGACSGSGWCDGKACTCQFFNRINALQAQRDELRELAFELSVALRLATKPRKNRSHGVAELLDRADAVLGEDK